MFVLDNTDLLQGDATNASEVDYAVFGLQNNLLKQLSAGQLAAAKGTLYTAGAADVISVVVLVNTGTAHNHVNLYIAPDAGTSRRLIAKDFQLEPGYSLHFEGGKVEVLSPTGVSGGGDPSYIMTFDDTSLVAGVLTVTHNFGHQYPGCPIITDNTGKMILPDEITFTTANAFTVDLTSYGALSGTWRVVVLDSGASTAADAVSDVAFGASWDGETLVAPSKNSVYDRLILEAKAILTVGGDTLYASAANELARLAKGAAQAMKGMNDAGTIPTYKTLKVSDAGLMTNASQPAFLAVPSSDPVNVTGDATAYTVAFATEIFDVGGNFASNTFTAPVGGKYLLSTALYVYGLTSAHNAITFLLTTSNKVFSHYSELTNPFVAFTPVISVLCDMDIGDTAVVSLTVGGGTKVVNIYTVRSFFSGALIC